MEKKLSEIFLTRDTQRKDLPKEYFIYPYAVSYTHLDVYKRQVEDEKSLCNAEQIREISDLYISSYHQLHTYL